MNEMKLFDAVSKVDERFIDRSLSCNGKHGKRTHRFVWNVLAACVVLAAVVGITSFALVAEAKEYNEALTFFKENGLSPEGLSRSDIKAVYRDITTESFAYDKTADVIRKSVSGWEIQHDEPTPEDLAVIWEMNTQRKDGIIYRFHNQENYDTQKGFDVFEKSILECYSEGKLIWTTEITDFAIEGCLRTDSDTAVWGFERAYSSTSENDGWHSFAKAWTALIDDNGNLLWTNPSEHGFKHELIKAMLYNDDGTLATFGYGIGSDEEKSICYSRIGADGKEICFNKIETGNACVWNAVHLGDAYLVQVGDRTSHDTAHLLKLDCDGNVLDDYTYTADDCEYCITDMIEFGGKIYLSAYAFPKQNNDGGRHEIANILDYALSKWQTDGEVPDEELTSVVRDNYTAVLLICDNNGKAPEVFYSVKGSLGDSLAVNDFGELEWDVHCIALTEFSPFTSAFTIRGICKLFRYSFNIKGEMTKQSDTGEAVIYCR